MGTDLLQIEKLELRKTDWRKIHTHSQLHGNKTRPNPLVHPKSIAELLFILSYALSATPISLKISGGLLIF